MKIIVLGAGVQGTLYGVRLARCGHDVTLVAKGDRAAELRERGAVLQHAITGRRDSVRIPVIDRLGTETIADLCLITVRREQIEAVLPDLAAAGRITRFLFLVNHANGSEWLYAVLGRSRVVLGFPGAAGAMEGGVDRYVEVAEQATAIEASAPEIAATLGKAGFRTELIRDMDSWLRRHAVFVTAVGGALYEVDCDAGRLASDGRLVRRFILAVREGWAALDRLGTAPPPLALRAIFNWVPLPLAVFYWRSLLRSVRGDFYFARHTRHAVGEMAALAADVLALTSDAMPTLRQLYAAIDARRATSATTPS